jgi:hypothetical protein
MLQATKCILHEVVNVLNYKDLEIKIISRKLKWQAQKRPSNWGA